MYALADPRDRDHALTTIGKPGQLTASAMLDAMPLWRGWQEEIATVIEGATSEEDAAARLTAWAEKSAADPDVSESIYEASVQADLGGQMFVRLVEVPESVPERALAAGDPRPSFLSMPFDEAIAAFLERRLISPEEFRALSDAARTRAFTATRLATDGLRERALRLLVESLQQGTTLQDFARQLRTEEIGLGVTPSDSFYLETVYRTNVQSAYGAGRYRQITSPVVRAARPFVQYRTAGDSRVRESHRLLNGRIFRQDDPEWSRYAPPNGYACRCGVVTLRESQVDPSRVVSARDLPAEAAPDPGFDSPPTVTLDA